jgi:AraC-like DNA-binding protein
MSLSSCLDETFVLSDLGFIQPSTTANRRQSAFRKLAVKTIFSTHSLHPRDRLDYWLDVSGQLVVKTNCRPDIADPFFAELAAESLANIGLMRVRMSTVNITHDKTHVARGADDDLLVCQPLSGSYFIEQDNREVVCGVGEFSLLETRLPYAVRIAKNSKIVIAKVPREDLECRIGCVSSFAAREGDGSRGVTKLMSSLLTLLPQLVSDLDPQDKVIIGTQLLDLLGASLVDSGKKAKLSSSKAHLLLNLRTAMLERLSQPHVTVQEIAASAGVSVRYANSLLGAQNQSLSHLFMEMRLERCKRSLEDPSQAHRSISEIAYAWGFSDTTHFTRRFKKMYGVLPSEFRNAATVRQALQELPRK